MSEVGPGAILAGRYRVDRKLGEGGMAVVWGATHVVTRQRVALKLLQPVEQANPKIVQRFLREARAASAVRHPNVVVIHDVLELEDQTPMMVMELLDGESLGERLERDPKLPIGEVATILLPVVSAVGTAHALGIVHRDLKPDNIFLSMTPDGLLVKVLDFGIAKLSAVDGDAAATGNLTGSGAMLGTPFYMAPEQIYGDRDIDYRADVWALGVILYECLAGVRPTQADNIGQILKIVTTGQIDSIRQLVPTLPAEVAALVMRMLGRERGGRPSMRDVHDVLAAYTDVTARPFGQPASARSLPPDSSAQVIRVSDSARPHAPTVDVAGRDAESRATADTVDSMGLDAAAPRRSRSRSMTGLVIAGAAVVVAGAVGVGTWRASRGTTVPSSGTAPPVASVAPAVEARESLSAAPPPASSSAAPRPEVPRATTTASPSAQRAAIVAHPTATLAPVASAKPAASGVTTSTGGVVEKPPF